MLLLFLFAFMFLDPAQLASWSAVWGGLTAIFVDLIIVYRLLPHKRAYWIK